MFSKVFFAWTGREAGGDGCNFVQIEIGFLILSFYCTSELYCNFEGFIMLWVTYKCVFFLFHGFILAEV